MTSGSVELRHSRLEQWTRSAPPSARIMDAEGIMLVHCIEYNGMVTHIVGKQCSALFPLLIVMNASIVHCSCSQIQIVVV
jgi:hypothetical protein